MNNLSADEPLPYERIAEDLEAFGTPRAHFGHLSDEDRIRVARRLAIHQSIVSVDGNFRDEDMWIFFHICGKVGISFDEARSMWNTSTREYIL